MEMKALAHLGLDIAARYDTVVAAARWSDNFCWL